MVSQTDRKVDCLELCVGLFPESANRLQKPIKQRNEKGLEAYPLKLATYCQDCRPDALSRPSLVGGSIKMSLSVARDNVR